MESCNTFIADCVVISCCCQCLVLQLLIYFFLELPRKMARKTREYAKKKLIRRKKSNPDEKDIARVRCQERGETRKGLDIEFFDNGHEWGRCMEEVERVLEEMSMRGEFAFGSFWRRENVDRGRVMACSRCVMSNKEELEYGCHVVNFHLIEVVEPG